jgi:hypothetical protein
LRLAQPGGPTDGFSIFLPPLFSPDHKGRIQLLKLYNLDDGESPKEQFYTILSLSLKTITGNA